MVYTCGDEVFARDTETNFWYRAIVRALSDNQTMTVEWMDPFDGVEKGLSEDNVRRTAEGLEGTDDGPITEWIERDQTRSRSSSEVPPR